MNRLMGFASLLSFAVAFIAAGVLLLTLFSQDYSGAILAGLITGGGFLMAYFTRKWKT